MTAAKVVRQEIWDRLREVALPDSRFHLNFAEVVPDFVGNDRALARIYELPCYQAGHLAFVAPDNCLAALRAQMLRDGLTMVVSTYGIYRGLVLLEPGMVPEGKETFAGWLDGLEHFGRTVTLGEISGLGRGRVGGVVAEPLPPQSRTCGHYRIRFLACRVRSGPLAALSHTRRGRQPPLARAWLSAAVTLTRVPEYRVSPGCPVSGSDHAAPPFPRPGPDGHGSPSSAVL